MDWDVLLRYAPSLLAGFGVTIMCWASGCRIGLAIGFAVALGADVPSRALKATLRVYVEILRGTPFLMQLFILYSGGPSIGLRLSATEAGVLGLGLYSSAYFSEIFRAGFASVPRGQIEAAMSVGMTPWDILCASACPTRSSPRRRRSSTR